jgi:hypothetical protein
MSSFRSCGTKPRAFWLVSLSLSVFSAALAQDITSFEEQRQSIRAPKANAAVGTDLFGDNVNLYNGTLSFKQTDVSLPGNNALPVMVGRRISTGETIQIGKSFGRWELDIPHLHGTFAHVDGWKSGDRGDARCTGFGAPPTAVGASGTSIWDPSEFWHGSYLYVPGAGDQRLLKPVSTCKGKNWVLARRCRVGLKFLFTSDPAISLPKLAIRLAKKLTKSYNL